MICAGMRFAAVKVQHTELAYNTESLDAYLNEARTVANLDHPHIVPVYDVGSTDDFPCFVVSKFVDGSDLATRNKAEQLGTREAADLVATVSEDVIPVYVEATAEETETRLLQALRKRYPAVRPAQPECDIGRATARPRRPYRKESPDRPRPVRAMAACQERRGEL